MQPPSLAQNDPPPEDLKRQLYLQLAQRSLPGTPFYPVLGLIVVVGSDYGGGRLWLVALVMALLVVGAVTRAQACRRAPSMVPEQRAAWYRQFAAATVLQAFSWTLFCVAGLATAEGDRLAACFLLWLCTAGIASGVPSSLGLDARLSVAVVSLLLIVPATLIFSIGTRQAIAVGVSSLLLAVFLVSLSKRTGVDHTRLASQAILLELRADQLREEIEERELAEAQVRAGRQHFSNLVKRVPVGILEFDEEGLLRSANPTGREIVEWSGSLFAPGKTLAEALGVVDLGEGELGSEPRLLEIGAERGELSRWVAVSRVEIAEADGSSASVVVLSDVTAQRRGEEEIRRARDAAETASRVKSEFLANMSHELRTPMNGIVGATDVLTEVDDDETRDEFLAVLRESTMRLLTVVDRILEYAALDRDHVAEDCEFGLEAVVEAAVTPSRATASAKELALTWEIAPDVPPLLFGDGAALGRVLRALVENAVAFTDTGAVRVGVELADLTAQRARLAFCVEDTGIGIPEERREAIFTPFEQADGSTTRVHEGVGLGLAIASRLVAGLGGLLEFESEVGCGTRFSFVIDLDLGGSAALAPEVAAGA